MTQRLCLIGVGLIGGSIARAARQRGLVGHINAWGRPDDEANLHQAVALGVIDSYTLDIAQAVDQADLVIIATPVGAFADVFVRLRPVWRETTCYSDVGSTKGNVVSVLQQVFGKVPGNFVPAHPIAGAEQSGVGAARDGLFENRKLVVTPLPETCPQTLSLVRQFWTALGAEVSEMSVAEHDAILAATSHLPHLLAFALVDLLDSKPERTQIYQLAASGFKDFTRIAGSDPVMWRDICLANRDQILPLLGDLQQQLSHMSDLLRQADGSQLVDLFARAQAGQQHFQDIFHSRSTS
ncbi:MAG: prephenate dehydrogenase/arogenate dehydrogenase family protein [Methylococcales bacterium]|nr:prephenate dehydrogenase/arogenate dehydrogenase family protein [Methylococcales bacterium]